MTDLRSRVIGWVGRKYIERKQKKGVDLLSLLPESTLMPLRRTELDPVAELGAKRETEPVTRLKLPFGLRAWLVTGYDEAKEVLAAAGKFSNDYTNLVGTAAMSADQNPGGLGFADPPDHTRLRKLLTPEFTMRRLSRLTPRIAEIIEDQLKAMAASEGPVDLMQSFALPIPSLTICELLGVSYEDRADFQRLSTVRFDLFAGAGASFGAISESLAYLMDIVKKQRESPGDGLLGMLIKEHGDEISDVELAGLADGVLTGGLETTASMLALGAIVLLRDRETFELVRDDDESINKFVEELLRYLTVVQAAFPRFAKEDVQIGDARIAEGDIVFVSLSGANRDAKLGENMEGFDPKRDSSSHLAFGWGVHRCIGAELARMELRAAYPALVRRFPEMHLAVAPEDLSYRQTSVVYGVDTLPVRLTR
ncbi:cytochrome P450 [Amycolatopsis acidiphila]|uniref:cytochrome P450 n=2 Tax=Amycolatopsis acidiphila TaxID=715473 RepID=UPI00174D2812|nr:cytochrome P450 [Amycolatopsis acidiphila]UIJ60833.1 cytochrome P450 [Amycolatopsis acidiphila]GHG94214.1 cytochrome P450 [Amycolatopsis acidiphila]